MSTYDQPAYGAALTRDQTRAVFGQVMGLVALTTGFAALGAYIGRNLSWWGGDPVLYRRVRLRLRPEYRELARPRAARDRAPVRSRPAARARGCTDHRLLRARRSRGAVAGRRRDGRVRRRLLARSATPRVATCRCTPGSLFWALLALIVFGLVTIFVSIPHSNIIYCVLGLVIFGGFTIVDFNRLRRANNYAAVPIAAGIFLDIFNVFLFFLQLFGGGDRR